MTELLLSGRTGRNAPLVRDVPKTVFAVPGVTDRRFEGKISYFGPSNDYGFIHCEELFERYGKDVFAPAQFIGERSPGDAVSFAVIFKKQGNPQAINIEDLDDVASVLASAGSEAAAAVALAKEIDEAALAISGFVIRSTGAQGDATTFPQSGDLVCISYTGRVANTGEVFDEDDECHFILGQGNIIAGIDAGVMQMSLGDEIQLLVHRTYGYAEIGAPTSVPVPPGSDLVFKVKLLAIERAQRTAAA